MADNIWMLKNATATSATWTLTNIWLEPVYLTQHTLPAEQIALLPAGPLKAFLSTPIDRGLYGDAGKTAVRAAAEAGLRVSICCDTPSFGGGCNSQFSFQWTGVNLGDPPPVGNLSVPYVWADSREYFEGFENRDVVLTFTVSVLYSAAE